MNNGMGRHGVAKSDESMRPAADVAGIGPSKRLAAIDVGTNSIRLIVVEAFADGTYRVIDDEKAITRLGRGFSQDGLLHEGPMESSVQAIARMKAIAEGYGVERLRCVGTCAVREASNGERFVALVREHAGVRIEAISAHEEARLAHASVAEAFDLSQTTAAVVDVGGGSTEIVLSSQGAVEEVFTLPLGAVRLTERYGECAANDDGAFERMRRKVRTMLKAAAERVPFSPQVMYGTGGTFTALASVCMQRGSARDGSEALPFSVRGYELRRADVRHTQDWLRGMPLRARGRAPGLSPDRAEIIIPGLTIVESVMKRLGVNTLRVHDRGIRDGIILEMIREAFGGLVGAGAARAEGSGLGDGTSVGGSGGRDRLKGVRHFAHACRYEEPHSKHVTGLALSIFDQLAAQTRPKDDDTEWRRADCREMLEAASLLHDIGYFINYARHHKHSYHLIVHADLPGFTRREVEIIANVARYHRRALPSAKKHRAFAVLPKGDRRLVRRLASILRLADGLDRNHTQGVTAARVSVQGGTAVIRVESTGDFGFDVWSAESKGELFQRAFGLGVRVEWANAPVGAGGARAVGGLGGLDGSASAAAKPRKRRHRAHGSGMGV
jgi:exopolyphosphatase/guanosine-5'-triphosphate,3'-diphosphate pyrophosphatase